MNMATAQSPCGGEVSPDKVSDFDTYTTTNKFRVSSMQDGTITTKHDINLGDLETGEFQMRPGKHHKQMPAVRRLVESKRSERKSISPTYPTEFNYR